MFINKHKTWKREICGALCSGSSATFLTSQLSQFVCAAPGTANPNSWLLLMCQDTAE